MLSRLRRWAFGARLWGHAPDPAICFDVSDLISHFGSARVPTGIQRVQIESIAALLRATSGKDTAIRICAFSEQRSRWAQIPNALFLQICASSLADGNVSEKAWASRLRWLVRRIRFARPLRFARGETLVNLGTSWWLKNYFPAVHNAKMKRGILFIPFVYDLVPLMAPEHCVPDLPQVFTVWVSDVFDYADHFLVSSKATQADLLSVAKKLGREVAVDAVTVVPLNADFLKLPAVKQGRAYLEAHGLKAQGYVLFVSTIESRKNHLGAFSAWLALIQKNGVANTPMLVCVGNEGWLNAAVYAKLEENALLRLRVMMLSKLPDDGLAQLYDSCLFTFYPSHYEGWGLPVTESLCHGKVPLISAVSSLPEAGGPFADYFEAGSQDSMVVALERLIFDDAHRAARERYIREAFRPRSWLEIGEQIEQTVANISRKRSSVLDTAQTTGG